MFLLFFMLSFTGCAAPAASISNESKVPAAKIAIPVLRGVNLAGLEFGEHRLPGLYEKDYIAPDNETIDHFMDRGMNAFRIPFRWERLQSKLFASLNARELRRLDHIVNHVTSRGGYVVLDVHNYARYYGEKSGERGVIGSDETPLAAFTDFWSKLARHYCDNAHVIFGIMNEPNTMPTEHWLRCANHAIAAIREIGAHNLVLVPGNGWTGAWSWERSDLYGTANSEVMTGIVDPAAHFMIEVHQYLDADSSGTSPDCIDPERAVHRLHDVTAWCKKHGIQAVLGEFGASDTPVCLEGLALYMHYMRSHPEVWHGWFYWAAGPWWGDYMFSIQPSQEYPVKPQSVIVTQ